MWFIPFYFLNLLRANIPTPTSPVPKRSKVAGSGTGFRLFLPVVGTPSTEVTAVEAKPELLFAGVTLPDVGQPAIPKNIITTHKTKYNFLIFSLFKYILLQGPNCKAKY